MQNTLMHKNNGQKFPEIIVVRSGLQGNAYSFGRTLAKPCSANLDCGRASNERSILLQA